LRQRIYYLVFILNIIISFPLLLPTFNQIQFFIIFVQIIFSLLILIIISLEHLLRNYNLTHIVAVLLISKLVVVILTSHFFILINLKISNTWNWWALSLFLSVLALINLYKFGINFEKLEHIKLHKINFILFLPLLVWIVFAILYQLIFGWNNLPISQNFTLFITYSVMIIFNVIIIYSIYFYKSELLPQIDLFTIIPFWLLLKFGWLVGTTTFRSIHGYWIISHVNYLWKTSSLDNPTLWYFQWPGFFYATIPVFSITNNIVFSMIFMEMITQFIIILFVYLIAIELFNDKFINVVIPLSLLVLQTINIWYYTPSVFGYALYTVLIYFTILLVKQIQNFDHRIKNKKLNFSLILIFIFIITFIIVLSHIGTLIFMVVNVFSILVVAIFSFDKTQIKFNLKHVILIGISIILGMIIIIVNLIGFNIILEQLFALSDFSTLQRRLTPFLTTGLRVYLQLFTFIILLSSVAFIGFTHIKSNKFQLNMIFIFITILLSNLTVAILTDYGSAESGEARSRVYIFSLLPILIILYSKFFTKNYYKIFIVLFIIISSGLHPVIYHSYDSVYLTRNEIDLTNDIYQNILDDFETDYYIISTRNNPIQSYHSDIFSFIAIPPDFNNTNLEPLYDLIRSKTNTFSNKILLFWFNIDQLAYNIQKEHHEQAFTFNSPLNLYYLYNLVVESPDWSVFKQIDEPSSIVLIYNGDE
jgi:hypothetical protein